jgi:hypothetical protein
MEQTGDFLRERLRQALPALHKAPSIGWVFGSVLSRIMSSLPGASGVQELATALLQYAGSVATSGHGDRPPLSLHQTEGGL